MAPRFAVGDTRSTVLVTDLTRTQIVQYAGASGDFNPVHTDERFATETAGFPGVFAHGMLTMALTGRLLTDTFGVERLMRFGGRFHAQVWPGDTLTSTLTVVSVGEQGGTTVVDAVLSTVNQDGVEVFSASASART